MTVEINNLQNGDDTGSSEHQADSQQHQQTIQRKRDKQKRKKQRRKQRRQQQGGQSGQQQKQQDESGSDGDEIEVEYVFEDPPELTDVKYRHFRKIFQAFRPVSEDSAADSARSAGGQQQSKLGGEYLEGMSSTSLSSGLAMLKARTAGMMMQQDEDEDEAAAAARRDEEDVQKLSKRKLKKLTRMSVAELKQTVDRPEVVEMHDVCSKDPKLLCLMKAYRNTVPVPRHWCAKRKYLQGKRGIEKPPFQLPDFIKATGIMEMRETVQEKDDAKTMKQKMRERVRPKVGKIDIDYQKLHDAFFKYQVKPPLTAHGDLYYEGREFETRLRAKKPGALSDELRTALGMPVGPGSERYPPPWLIAMQRYGPPPAFPRLRIPGLNAPIPEGCSFGYHAGGWGKPPVDVHGRPVYGDVFGYAVQPQLQPADSAGQQPTERHLWGELESESSSEEEDEDEDEDEEDQEEDEAGDGDDTGLAAAAAMSRGAATPSGALSSATPAGLETPDMIELRKQQRTAAAVEAAMEGDGEEVLPYRVLPEVQTSVGDAFMGSSKIYALGAAAGGSSATPGATSGSRKRPPPPSRAGQAESAQQQAGGVSAAKKYQKDYKF